MDTKREETEATRTARPQDLRPGASSGGRRSALAVVVVVAVIAAGIWAVVSDDGATSETAAAPTHAPASTNVDAGEVETGPTIYLWDPNTGDTGVVHSARREPANAELSPDGRRLVYEAEAPDGTSQIYLLEDDGTERRLTHMEGGAYEPTWSPDGSGIAFAASRSGDNDPQADPDIFVMKADGSNIRRLVGTRGYDGSPDWSPDGRRIAFHGEYDANRGRIWVASVRSGALTRLTPPNSWDAMDPAWSPDGRWIAYSRYENLNTLNGKTHGADLWLMRPDGTDQGRVTHRLSDRVSENPSWSPDGRLVVFEQHKWDWTRNRVLVINPRTGRVLPILAGAEAAPSWGRDGILLSLSSGFPAPSPGEAPPRFQLEPPRIDATITMTGSRCELGGVDGPVRPGELRLELVNESHLDGMFTMVGLAPGQTLADIRADYSGAGWSNIRRDTRYVGRSKTNVWSSSREVARGRWAVTCWKDVILAPHAGQMNPVGVVAIRVG